jgi:phosphotransferase system IIA component
MLCDAFKLPDDFHNITEILLRVALNTIKQNHLQSKSPPPFSKHIKSSDRHDGTEILLKVALNTINLTLNHLVI